jgi:aldose 1-epimerase
MMEINKTRFGNHGGNEISLYELKNDNDMIVKVMNYGATITSISIPNEKGGRSELVCGFDSFNSYFTEEYIANAPYFGCTVGRYSSQIKDSEFYIDGKEYLLAANCGDNSSHGGVIGFDKNIWKAKEIEEDGAVGVQFYHESRHMDEGFPGNLKVYVTMILTNANEIKIDYSAKTTTATPLSFTNHTYFNLSGFERSVEGFKAQVFTDKLLEIDDTGAATGVVNNVEGTDNDLRKGRIVKDVHDAIGDGFEHFYVFDNPGFELNKVAEVADPENGRTLEVFSKEPCMLFYTGKYTSDELKRENGDAFGKYKGFCCETQRFPNGPNIENSPGSITRPNETYQTQTVFKLSF